MIRLIGICSLRSHIPSSAGHHRQNKRRSRCSLTLLFHTASALERARIAGYKTTAPDCRQALVYVIRLGFAKVRCFTGELGALLVLLVLVKGLIYNVISVFIVVWVNGKTLDFA